LKRARQGLARVVVALLIASPAMAKPRLEVRGTSLSSREVDAAFAAGTARSDSAWVAEGLGLLVARLQDRGHLDASARADSIPGVGNTTLWQVQVHEGPRTRFASVTIETTSRVDSTLFAGALGLKAGDWASPRAVTEAVTRAVDGAVAAGHPYARLAIAEFDWDSAGARLRLSGALGPQVMVAGVRLEGLRTTRPSLVKRAMGPLENRPFDPAAALAARDRAVQLGLFRSVTYEGLEGHGDWGRADLVYRFEEPTYHHVEGALGVQGNRQLVGLARVELDNLAGTGRAARLGWESRGAGLQDFDARYSEPYLFGTGIRLDLAIRQQLEDTLWTRTVGGLQARFGLGSREHGELGYEQERVVQPAGEVRQASLQTTRFAFETDRRDDPLLGRRGWFGRLEGAESFQKEQLRPGGSRRSNVGTVLSRFEILKPLRRDAGGPGLAWELSFAGRFSSQRELPEYQKLPLGGAASLRGFDERQFLVDRYLLSRFEWRWWLGRGGQRIGLFWDHAETITRETDELGRSGLANGRYDGVGFGLRVATRGGLAGIEYGLEPGRPPTEGKLHLRLVSRF
jgi:outer membrane protein assembly factor BamA